jgi:hypothetical protein
MSAQKLLSSRFPAAHWIDPVPLQNISNRAAGNLVPQIGQRTLDAPITQSRFSSAI